MSELDALIEVSIEDIKELYKNRSSLDRSWKGTLIITVAQYLCSYHSNKLGKQIPAKRVS